MLLEALEWCLTPCPWASRRSGFLAAQIAIRHRAIRCRKAWRPHLESCKIFTAESIGSAPPTGNALILGSGHLRDFDLPFLRRRFRRIVLADAVHPLEIQILARFSKRKVQLATEDLAVPSPQIQRLAKQSEWTISCCLLSQLPLGPNSRGATETLSAHLALLQSSQSAILITDTAKRTIGTPDWHSVIENHPLPGPDKTWTWLIAPPGETGKDGEERLIAAALFNYPPS
jgi:hypothetical protein